MSTMTAGVSSGWGGASPRDQFVAEMEGFVSLLHWALWRSSYLWNGCYFLVYFPGDSPFNCREIHSSDFSLGGAEYIHDRESALRFFDLGQ